MSEVVDWGVLFYDVVLVVFDEVFASFAVLDVFAILHFRYAGEVGSAEGRILHQIVNLGLTYLLNMSLVAVFLSHVFLQLGVFSPLDHIFLGKVHLKAELARLSLKLKVQGFHFVVLGTDANFYALLFAWNLSWVNLAGLCFSKAP